MILCPPFFWKACIGPRLFRPGLALLLACTAARAPVSAQPLRDHPIAATLRDAPASAGLTLPSLQWLTSSSAPAASEDTSAPEACALPAPAAPSGTTYLPTVGASTLRFAARRAWTPDLPPPPPPPEPVATTATASSAPDTATAAPTVATSPDSTATLPAHTAPSSEPPPRIIPDELRPPVAPEELLYYFERPGLAAPPPLVMPPSTATYRTTP